MNPRPTIKLESACAAEGSSNNTGQDEGQEVTLGDI